MFSMDLTIPRCGGSAVVALRGELDVAEAATAAARLAAGHAALSPSEGTATAAPSRAQPGSMVPAAS